MDLLAMFRTLGHPTFFIMFTADDMSWPDLLYVLGNREGMDVTVEDVYSKISMEYDLPSKCRNSGGVTENSPV